MEMNRMMWNSIIQLRMQRKYKWIKKKEEPDMEDDDGITEKDENLFRFDEYPYIEV